MSDAADVEVAPKRGRGRPKGPPKPPKEKKQRGRPKEDNPKTTHAPFTKLVTNAVTELNQGVGGQGGWRPRGVSKIAVVKYIMANEPECTDKVKVARSVRVALKKLIDQKVLVAPKGPVGKFKLTATEKSVASPKKTPKKSEGKRTKVKKSPKKVKKPALKVKLATPKKAAKKAAAKSPGRPKKVAAKSPAKTPVADKKPRGRPKKVQ